jgi:hypothetical protein
MLVKAVPNILNIAMKIDCPLSVFPRLKNMTTNSTDISKFCPKAAYTPLLSPRKVPPNNIILKAEAKGTTKAEYNFNG